VTSLRPYQVAVVAKCNYVIANGKRRPIIVAATGAGKTVIAVAIIKTGIAEGRRVLVLGHTREIIKQTSLKLSGYEVEHGVIQAGLVANLGLSVQVASIQTLWSRAMRTGRMPLPAADLLVIDEAHHCPRDQRVYSH
jgi:DNA repair protein RadD